MPPEYTRRNDELIAPVADVANDAWALRYAAANGQEYQPGEFIEKKRDPDDLHVSEAYAQQWAAEVQDGLRGMTNRIADDKRRDAEAAREAAKQQLRDAKELAADAASDAGTITQGS